MAIKLANDVTLPNIPDDLLAEYPYAVITHMTYDGDFYLLLVSKAVFGHLLPEVTGTSYELVASQEAGILFKTDINSDEWTREQETNLCQLGTGIGALVWANHNIYEVTAYDSTTGESTFGTELYCAKFFELDNGVSIPSIPDDAFDTYPYGAIVNIRAEGMNLFGVVASAYPFAFIPLALVQSGGNTEATMDGIGTVGPGGIMYQYIVGMNTNWGDGQSYDEPAELPMGSGYEIVWANYDVCIATAYDADTQEITVGEEIYFLDSTVEYPERLSAAARFFKRLAYNVRRLVGVTKRYTTDEMIEKLDEVEPGTTTIEVTVNADDSAITIIGFTLSSDERYYGSGLFNANIANFAADKTYAVVWDGVLYICPTISIGDMLMLGNPSIMAEGISSGNGEPFNIGFNPDTPESLLFYTTDEATSHTIAIYEATTTE